MGEAVLGIAKCWTVELSILLGLLSRNIQHTVRKGQCHLRSQVQIQGSALGQGQSRPLFDLMLLVDL